MPNRTGSAKSGFRIHELQPEYRDATILLCLHLLSINTLRGFSQANESVCVQSRNVFFRDMQADKHTSQAIDQLHCLQTNTHPYFHSLPLLKLGT